MTHHDESLMDKVKNALGMGDAHDDRTDADATLDRDPDDLGVDGATQATGREGTAGGTGASGAMGGAGAGGPVGADPDPSTDVTGGPTPGNAERTEYEMGHEFDPQHEKRADSGVLAEPSGEAEVDTWRRDDSDS